MSWCWLALLTGADATAAHGGAKAPSLAAAAVSDVAGKPVGVLAAWPSGAKPVAAAVRADARIVDPEGGSAWVSLVLLARDRSPLFDDPAVSAALRRVLAGPPPDAVSTLVRDSSHIAGALTVRRSQPALLRDDPFRAVGPARVLLVAAGLLGTMAPVPGPVTQRYGGQPWPAAGFPVPPEARVTRP